MTGEASTSTYLNIDDIANPRPLTDPKSSGSAELFNNILTVRKQDTIENRMIPNIGSRDNHKYVLKKKKTKQNYQGRS